MRVDISTGCPSPQRRSVGRPTPDARHGRGRSLAPVEVGTLGGTHRGHIVYRLTAPPPMARLEALGLGAAFEWNDRAGELHARLAEGSRTDLAAANDAVLRLLLDHGIGVLAVDPGSRVEALYLDRPPRIEVDSRRRNAKGTAWPVVRQVAEEGRGYAQRGS